MNFFEGVIDALTTIWANKLRSGLTMLGIVIGVSSVVIMIAIGQGAQSGITEKLQSMGTNLLMVTGGGSSDMRATLRGGGSGKLEYSDYEALLELEGVTGIAPQISSNTQAIYGSTNTSVQIYGILPNYFELKDKEILSGTGLSQADQDERKRVCVIDETAQEDLFGAVDPIGKDIHLDGKIFTIIGVVEGEDGTIFTPLATAQLRLLGSKNINMISVFVTNAEDMDKVQSEIENILLAKHRITDENDADFSVTNQATMLEAMSAITQMLTLMLGGIAAISLIVGGIGVMNIMLVSVTERTREIGIRKAIGAHPNDIMIQFLTESSILSILGGVIGIIMSFIATYLLTSLIGVSTSISIPSIFFAFAFSAFVGIIFGLLPARKAALLETIDALRFE